MKKEIKSNEIVKIKYIPYFIGEIKGVKLSHTSILLLGLIQLYINEFGKSFYFSDEQLCKLLKKKESCIQGALAILDKENLIDRHSTFDRHTRKSSRTITLGRKGKELFKKDEVKEKKEILQPISNTPKAPNNTPSNEIVEDTQKELEIDSNQFEKELEDIDIVFVDDNSNEEELSKDIVEDDYEDFLKQLIESENCYNINHDIDDIPF